MTTTKWISNLPKQTRIKRIIHLCPIPSNQHLLSLLQSRTKPSDISTATTMRGFVIKPYSESQLWEDLQFRAGIRTTLPKKDSNVPPSVNPGPNLPKNSRNSSSTAHVRPPNFRSLEVQGVPSPSPRICWERSYSRSSQLYLVVCTCDTFWRYESERG